MAAVERHMIPQHLTASGMVICQDHILLVHHRRIGAWVPPGGHVEVDELPHETAIREIEEETGVQVEIISPPLPQTGDPDALFLPEPLYVQAVLAVENGTRFYHLDLAYLCRPAVADKLPELRSNREVKEARWVSIDQADQIALAKNVKEALVLAKDKIAQLRVKAV
jgi:8-oxo-dGTP pyrophosphatase MutT (NUDIX family)